MIIYYKSYPSSGSTKEWSLTAPYLRPYGLEARFPCLVPPFVFRVGQHVIDHLLRISTPTNAAFAGTRRLGRRAVQHPPPRHPRLFDVKRKVEHFEKAMRESPCVSALPARPAQRRSP
jgi:hypothetical protein